MAHALPWWLRQWRICLQCRRPGFHPCVRKIPWRRKRQPIPVFLPGKSRGQRTLAGDSPWGRRVRHDRATGTRTARPTFRPRGTERASAVSTASHVSAYIYIYIYIYIFFFFLPVWGKIVLLFRMTPFVVLSLFVNYLLTCSKYNVALENIPLICCRTLVSLWVCSPLGTEDLLKRHLFSGINTNTSLTSSWSAGSH